jgi:membrane-bound lytic murein transglycosylase F
MLASVIAAILIFWTWPALKPPHDSGLLVVATRQSAATYYLDADGDPAGFEYELAAEFARRNDLELEVILSDSVDDLVSSVGEGKAHLAAGWLAVTTGRSGRLRFGPAYASEREVVVCGPLARQPKNFRDLAPLRVEVVQGSSHIERLLEVRQAHPGLRWVEMDGISSEDMLERTASGLADCTVADASSYELARHFWPKLQIAMVLTERRDIAWAMPNAADTKLRQELADFFRAIRADGWLERLRERHFGHLNRLDEADARGILSRRVRLLPRYKMHFKQAADETGLDWRLLAALAYQESHWDPLAKSPTGVRGIMMLTAETADRMGVSNRLDPKESILAGARYLAMLRDQMPQRIADPDRTWMALAAYNIGLGHLEDARRLTQKLDKNPDAWHDVKEVLPLLAQGAYARSLRLGFARGGEARLLTENVRIYYDILKRFESNGLEF